MRWFHRRQPSTKLCPPQPANPGGTNKEAPEDQENNQDGDLDRKGPCRHPTESSSAHNKEDSGKGVRNPRSAMSLMGQQTGGKGKSAGGKVRDPQSLDWHGYGAAAQQVPNSVMSPLGKMFEDAFHDVAPQHRCRYSLILVVVFLLAMVLTFTLVNALVQLGDTEQPVLASEKGFWHEVSPQRLHMDLKQDVNHSVVSWPHKDSILNFHHLEHLLGQEKPSITELVFDLASEITRNATSRESTTQTEAMHATVTTTHISTSLAPATTTGVAATTAAAASTTWATMRTFTTTVFAAVQVTTTMQDDHQSLFCFMVTRADEPQRSLVVAQLVREVGIFVCDQQIVFSDTAFILGLSAGNVVQTQVIPTRLGPAQEPPFQELALSASVFAQVWIKVLTSGTFRNHKWTVKVDPESVFLPAQLRVHLRDTWGVQRHAYSTSGLYLRNCLKEGKSSSTQLLSSIEVFSSRAIEVFAGGVVRCTTTLAHYSRLTENVFMQECMDMLKVHYETDLSLVYDAGCGHNPSPCVAHIAAFHPFSTADQQQACIREVTAKVNFAQA